MAPTVLEELNLRSAGYQRIAGIDEAGRGCWAGPVVAAAVVLPEHILVHPEVLEGVDDSKMLSPSQRETLFVRITELAECWAPGIVPAHVIDTHGILAATRIAMQVALLSLPVLPDALLIDAVTLHGWPCPQRALIKGDGRCLSIAAASIIAKVTRDRLMIEAGRYWPDYGFDSHKGYGTALHANALRAHGIMSHHRRSFRPIAELIEQ